MRFRSSTQRLSCSGCLRLRCCRESLRYPNSSPRLFRRPGLVRFEPGRPGIGLAPDQALEGRAERHRWIARRHPGGARGEHVEVSVRNSQWCAQPNRRLHKVPPAASADARIESDNLGLRGLRSTEIFASHDADPDAAPSVATPRGDGSGHVRGAPRPTVRQQVSRNSGLASTES